MRYNAQRDLDNETRRRASALVCKKRQRNRVRHRFIARRRWMQMIAAVVGREQLIRVLRVAHYGVEIENRIEMPGTPYPRIHRLSVRLAQRSWVVIVRAHIRCDGSPVDSQTMCMSP